MKISNELNEYIAKKCHLSIKFGNILTINLSITCSKGSKYYTELHNIFNLYFGKTFYEKYKFDVDLKYDDVNRIIGGIVIEEFLNGDKCTFKMVFDCLE